MPHYPFSITFWSGRPDSNRRPPEPHSGTLNQTAPRPGIIIFNIFWNLCQVIIPVPRYCHYEGHEDLPVRPLTQVIYMLKRFMIKRVL
jgi:hypothetical protein